MNAGGQIYAQELQEQQDRFTGLANVLGFTSIDHLEDFVILQGTARVVPASSIAAAGDSLPLEDTQTQSTSYSDTRHAQRNEERKRENMRLKSEVEEVRKELNWLRREHEKHVGTIEGLRDDKSRLLKMVDEADKKADAANARAEQAEAGGGGAGEGSESYQEQVAALAEETSALYQRIDDLEETIAGLEEAKRTLEEQLDSAQQFHAELVSSIDLDHIERYRLQTKLDTALDERDDAIEERDGLRAEVESNRGEIERLKGVEVAYNTTVQKLKSLANHAKSSPAAVAQPSHQLVTPSSRPRRPHSTHSRRSISVRKATPTDHSRLQTSTLPVSVASIPGAAPTSALSSSSFGRLTTSPQDLVPLVTHPTLDQTLLDPSASLFADNARTKSLLDTHRPQSQDENAPLRSEDDIHLGPSPERPSKTAKKMKWNILSPTRKPTHSSRSKTTSSPNTTKSRLLSGVNQAPPRLPFPSGSRSPRKGFASPSSQARLSPGKSLPQRSSITCDPSPTKQKPPSSPSTDEESQAPPNRTLPPPSSPLGAVPLASDPSRSRLPLHPSHQLLYRRSHSPSASPLKESSPHSKKRANEYQSTGSKRRREEKDCEVENTGRRGCSQEGSLTAQEEGIMRREREEVVGIEKAEEVENDTLGEDQLRSRGSSRVEESRETENDERRDGDERQRTREDRSAMRIEERVAEEDQREDELGEGSRDELQGTRIRFEEPPGDYLTIPYDENRFSQADCQEWDDDRPNGIALYYAREFPDKYQF
ncbi:hypothetical protein JCM5350_002397 [Sporobolomyces pararoseus]